MRLIDTFLGLWLMMRPEIGPTTFTKTWQVHSLNRTSHSQLYAARARFVSLSAPCRVRQLGVPFRNSHKTQVVVAGGEGRPSTNERVSGVIGTSQRRHQSTVFHHRAGPFTADIRRRRCAWDDEGSMEFE